MTRLRELIKRYSLHRRGWHRFWFAMLALSAYAALLIQMIPPRAERDAAAADFKQAQLKSCQRSCSPKAGYLTSEHPNPLFREPNHTGYRREASPRCVCLE